jgi:hypothetical protein
VTPAAPFQFDEIGYWSELKLEIVERYGSAYTTAFANQKELKKYYIDACVQAAVRTHLIHRPARDIIPPLGASQVFSYLI